MKKAQEIYSWEYHNASDLERHQASWDSLNSRCASSALLSSAFLVPVIRLLGTGKEVLAICRKDNSIVACVLLENPRFGVWQTFQPSQVPLGPWLSDNRENLESLLYSLQRTLPGFCMVLGITQQDPDHIPRPANTGRIRTLDYIRTARISIKDSFEDYWKQRGKNLRHNIKRQRNLLAKEMTDTRLELVYGGEQLVEAVNEYGHMESSGWKAAGGTAISATNVQGQLYKALLTDFSKTGNAAVCRYFYNDTLVSTDMCISGNKRLIILKTTFDEQQTRTSPTMLMHHEFFEMLFNEKKFEMVEFYGKVMDWHTKWTDEIRVLFHINTYRWGWLAGLLGRSDTA